MTERSIKQIKEERGIVLILSLLVMVILSVLTLGFLTIAKTEATIASNFRNHTQAFYAAEAGVESAVANLRTLLGSSASPTDAQLGAIVPPALTDPNYTFATFQIRRVRPTPPYAYPTVVPSGPYQGLSALATDYQISTEVRGPRGSRAQLNQRVQQLQIPLFQFGVFYGRGVDLEIAPGPPMTFNGRVHANSNIYVRNSSSRFDSFMTTAGSIYRYVKRSPSTRGSNPPIKDGGGTYRTLNFDHEYDQDFHNPWTAQDWTSAALNTFGGLVLDAAMGVQEIVPPVPAAFYDPDNPDVSAHLMIEKGSPLDSPELQAAKLYYQADLRILNTTGNAKDTNGRPVKLLPGVITPKTFYDRREEANILVIEVDIGALVASGKAPANGILYVAHNGIYKGVRLVNGSQLPPGGLTVVSENPVYIQGDYNTVNKVPAAVLADAVTVLSNNWGKKMYDQKGRRRTWRRPAADTTVNAAFALGPNAESDVGRGNGQLENVIRFLEDWNGKTFTYNGSIVALWHSQQAVANWRCCGSSGDNYYRPPKRNWAYDPLFNTQLPPGTPVGIVNTRGQWSQG
ncbi:MAG: PilX N-terminal domain-containing pilus assembly protein [Candidatus Methylomirabilales bacterium]